ncbi:uncharacterized protein LOC119356663 [Triticum dicoccoides]|uniref:uncharacterized protein LOC119356663 n=1 Tax=Triticum dicoccoides TaxID=85692 RepID=UPI00188F8B39|nr:uncharacterized protein LOC119356663 [Triticum dicoccoides]
MAAAAALGGVDDLDFDLGFMDGFEFDLLDMDLTEFCGGDGECLLPAVADKEGGFGLDPGSRDGGDGGRESSPDSVVTDDGAPPSESHGDRDDGGMSTYASELERFLMEDDDGGDAGGPLDLKEPAADDYFLGDLDGRYAEPATPGKDLVLDDYFLGDLVSYDYFYDLAAADDAASPATEEEDASAREDDYYEATSRKRARQRKGAAAVSREAELRGAPVMHGISSISTGIGCRPLGHHWLHPCTTVCLLA